jgi:anti-sigma regulatory factor (Ser/Thr protein kinase)
VTTIAEPLVIHRWTTLSFASTLFLQPVLDLLLGEIPDLIQTKSELRLGLHEALVNAAKHGNKLDPSKLILVRYSAVEGQFWWVIADQGCGFQPHYTSVIQANCPPCVEAECGRGLYILHQIFDQVYWNAQGTELSLYKRLTAS